MASVTWSDIERLEREGAALDAEVASIFGPDVYAEIEDTDSDVEAYEVSRDELRDIIARDVAAVEADRKKERERQLAASIINDMAAEAERRKRKRSEDECPNARHWTFDPRVGCPCWNCTLERRMMSTPPTTVATVCPPAPKVRRIAWMDTRTIGQRVSERKRHMQKKCICCLFH